ncbi:MAG: hypothetical protein Q4D26_07780 [Clostridia bacterium]|nr:hypothetical protein [Clostridia bacterium]
MKLPNATEMIEKLAKESAIKDIYIMALEAKQNGQSFDDFIKELEALKK